MIPPGFVQIPFITRAFERAYFRPGLGDEGLMVDVLEGCGGPLGGPLLGAAVFLAY